MISPRRARVSLCMIVRNEEAHLADCLTPVADVFDEIVIVDTGSTDGTREIAARFTPQVHAFPWCDDFAAARNESLRHATGEWIFWLDADDRLAPAQVAKLGALLAELGDEPRVYCLDTLLPSREAFLNESLVQHPRLFRRHPQLQWKGRVHEQLSPNPAALGYATLDADIEIEHLGYLDPVVNQRKTQRKLRLLRLAYAVDPDDASTLLHLGMAHACLGLDASEYLGRLIAQPTVPLPLLRRAYAALAEQANSRGRFEEALDIIEQGLRRIPGDEQLLYIRAQGEYERCQHDRAAATLHEILQQSRPRHLLAQTPGGLARKLAPRMLGAILRMQRRFGDAEAVLFDVLQRSPGDLHTCYLLGLVYLDAEQGAKLALITRQLQAAPAGGVYGRLLEALWAMRHHDLPAAGGLIDALVAEAPRLAMPRMLRVEWLSRCGASREQLVQSLRDLLRIQPGNLEGRYWLQQLAAAAPPPVPKAAPAIDWNAPILAGVDIAAPA